MADKKILYGDLLRRCLPLALWPAADRTAWDSLFVEGDILDGTVGPGTLWKPTTQINYRQSYGRWLTFVIGQGLLANNQEAPWKRVTPERVAAYLAELVEQDMSSWTSWGRMAGLLCLIEAMAPKEDFGWLRRIVRYYERQTVDRRKKAPRLQPSHIMLDWALRHIENAQHRAVQRVGDRAYRNALIIGLLSCCPVRLANLTMIEIDRHLVRLSTGYVLRFAPNETKTGHLFSAPLSRELTAPLDQYISVVRPRLLKGPSHARLWVSERGTPMSGRTIHEAVTVTTEVAFGRSINVHLFRDCAATFVALEDPEHIGIVSPLLGHVDPRAAERHYIEANQIVAGRRLRSSVAQARKILPPSKGKINK